MKIICRLDTKSRTHYLLEDSINFMVKPKLLYAGKLNQESSWKDAMHQHKFAEILFITQGTGKIFTDDDVIDVEEGDVIIYNASTNHFEVSSFDTPLESYFIAFDKISLSEMKKNTLIPEDYPIRYKSNELFGVLVELFDNIIFELSNKEPFHVEIAQSFAKTILIYIFRLIDHTIDTSKILASNPQFVKVLDYVDEHFKEEFSLEDLSSKFFMNKFYVSHLFKNARHTSIKNYILMKRLETAQELLKDSSSSASKICEQVGFTNLNYFCRAFKKTYDLTPLEYRKKSQKSQKKPSM